MAVITFFKTKDSTVTIGSTDEKSRIQSDVTISGGEKTKVTKVAADGTSHTIVGGTGPVTVEFDFTQGDSVNISNLVYAGTTTGITTTVTWDSDGTPTTITISNVEREDGNHFVLTLTDVKGISCPITQVIGDEIMRHFTGEVEAQNVLEQVTTQ